MLHYANPPGCKKHPLKGDAHKHHLNEPLLNQKDTVLQVDLLGEVHFTGDGGENETFLPAVGQGELNLSVQATRTQQGRVQRVCSVGGHDHLRGRIQM